MSPESVVIAGDRELRGSLDSPSGAACVVACPPHPSHGGTRNDHRLTAVAEALGSREYACLRFDYGPWAGGIGERRDVETAVNWAQSRYDRVGLFGYSFGASLALIAARDVGIVAVSALAPTTAIADYDVAAAVRDLPVRVAVQIMTGTRDSRVTWEPVVSAIDDGYGSHESFPTDHFFIGFESAVAKTVAEFFGSVFAEH